MTRYTFSVEPGYNKGSRDWTNMFAITRFHYDLIQWNLDITNFYITKVLDTTTIFFTLVIVKYMKKNLDITKPRYSEHFLPVPWPFVISRFYRYEVLFHIFAVTGAKNETEDFVKSRFHRIQFLTIQM